MRPLALRAGPARRTSVVGVVLLLVFGAVVALSVLRDNSGTRPKVHTATAEKRDVTARVLAQGKVRARQQVEVASELGGRVNAVFVKTGDVVKKGDLLFGIDDEQLKNAVAQLDVAYQGAKAVTARAQLGLAEAERAAARDKGLNARGVVAEDAYKLTLSRVDLAHADVDQAEAGAARTALDLKRAQDALRRARVTAPIAGTVVSVGVEVGQVVSPVQGVSDGMGGGVLSGMPLAPVVIADLAELIVRLDVDELDVGSIKTGQQARILAQGLKDFAFTGTVERVGLMGHDQAGAVLFSVEVLVQQTRPHDEDAASAGRMDESTPPPLPAPREVLRPGMSAQAEIDIETLAGTVTVPVAAVLEATGARGAAEHRPDRVFVLDAQSVAHQVTVRLGPAEDDVIAILDGVRAGDTVVSGPFRALAALTEGDAVVRDGEDKPAAAPPARPAP